MKRPRLVLLLCIAVAFVLWVLFTLTNEYSSYFRYAIEVQSNMEGRVEKAIAENTLFLRGKTRGFYIIRTALNKQTPILRLFVDQALINAHPVKENEFFIVTDDIHNLVNESLGSDMNLESIFTDTLLLNYPREYYKKVPVSFVSDIGYYPQYMSFRPVKLLPDSVLIYGQSSALALVDQICTRKVSYEDLNHMTEGMVRLEVPDGTRLSQKEVEYQIEVERFVELTMEVPLVRMNVPVKSDLFLLPDKVMIQFRCPFKKAATIRAEDFTLAVDYNKFIESKSGKVCPIAIKTPDKISHLEITPGFVDGIVQLKH